MQQAMADHEKNFLRDRIDQLLLVQKAKDLNITVDSEISKRVAQIQRDSGIADPEKFQEYVKEGTGMSFEDFKLEMKNDMLRQRVIRQEVGDKVNIKHDEIEKYYNEHKTEFVRQERLFLREILVSTESKDAAGQGGRRKEGEGPGSTCAKGRALPGNGARQLRRHY